MAERSQATQLFIEDMEYTKKYFHRLCIRKQVITTHILEVFTARMTLIFNRHYLAENSIQFVSQIRSWIRELVKSIDANAETILQKLSRAV